MIELTERAEEILRKADEAARRLNPGARVRLAPGRAGLETSLTDAPEPGDAVIERDGLTVYVEATLAGVVDAGEHDRLLLRQS